MLWTWMLASAAAAGSPVPMPPDPVEHPWGSRPATSFIDGDTVHVYGVLYDDMLQPLRELLARADVLADGDVRAAMHRNGVVELLGIQALLPR